MMTMAACVLSFSAVESGNWHSRAFSFSFWKRLWARIHWAYSRLLNFQFYREFHPFHSCHNIARMMPHRIFDWKYVTIHCHVSWLYTTIPNNSCLRRKINITFGGPKCCKKISKWLAWRISPTSCFNITNHHKPRTHSWTSRNSRSNFFFRSSVRDDFTRAFHQETGQSITQNRRLQFCFTDLQLQCASRVSFRSCKSDEAGAPKCWSGSSKPMQINTILIHHEASWSCPASDWFLSSMFSSEHSLHFGMTQKCRRRYSQEMICQPETCLFYHPPFLPYFSFSS